MTSLSGSTTSYNSIATDGAGTIVVVYSIYQSWTISVSTDHGSTWQDVVIPTGGNPVGLQQATVYYGNGEFVIVGNAIYTSADGLLWANNAVNTVNTLLTAAYGSGTWIVSTITGEYLTSV
jgi:hypothetical protein